LRYQSGGFKKNQLHKDAKLATGDATTRQGAGYLKIKGGLSKEKLN